MISIDGSIAGCFAAFASPLKSPTSFNAADRAIETIGQRTVVSGGQMWAAIGVC